MAYKNYLEAWLTRII